MGLKLWNCAQNAYCHSELIQLRIEMLNLPSMKWQNKIPASFKRCSNACRCFHWGLSRAQALCISHTAGSNTQAASCLSHLFNSSLRSVNHQFGSKNVFYVQLYQKPSELVNSLKFALSSMDKI